MPAPLPWNELAETTGFKNKREMLSTLYREWTSEAIAELLGIGRQTILNHLAQEGITKRKPGGYNTIKYKEILRIPKVKLEQMTSREIAEKNRHYSGIYVFCM